MNESNSLSTTFDFPKGLFDGEGVANISTDANNRE